MKPRDMLLALVTLYWRGGVSQGKAARLIGLRKQTFAELADGYMLLELLEQGAWRYYLERFNHRFPECDPRSVRRDPLAGKGLGIRMFTDDELLTPPQRTTLNDVVNGNWQTPCLDKIDEGKVIAPRPSFPRALPRVVGQQSDTQDDDSEWLPVGPEFEFNEAA